MKILVMNDHLTGGGVENVMRQLVDYLYSRGHQITIATDALHKKEMKELYPADIAHFSCEVSMPYPSGGGVIARGYHKILRILKKTELHVRFKVGYDVVIAMKEGPCMRRAAACGIPKKIGWVHVDYRVMHWTDYCFDSDEAERACMQAFDSVVCVSEAVARSVRETVGDPGNLAVRYNPLDYQRITEMGSMPCPEKKPEGKLLFVTVGRLVEEKNYLMLVDVCTKLREKADFELWIIGDGEQRESLEKRINQYGLTCVKLLGQRENPYTFIRQADCFVSSSKIESYGLAIQEALVVGVPVVATECPAVAETLSRQFGICCENSFDGLYSALEGVLEHPEELMQLSENIQKDYPREDLCEKRLESICALWEKL